MPSSYRDHLPQLDGGTFLTDGGLETCLIFDDGFDLPDFAAFVLLDDPAGTDALLRYFESYAEIAARDGAGIVLESATWRASADWGDRLGYSAPRLADVNRMAVALLEDVRKRFDSATSPVVVSGCVGPRGDGYQPDALMTAEEAQAYHAPQIATFAGTDADLVTAITMTYPEEAIGIVRAARAAGMPVVVSFTVETDGRLPTGMELGDAISTVDAATDSYPAYYMINCAHPTHFTDVLAGAPWMARVRGIRANASALSHAELDEAEALDAGDPQDLAQRYLALRAAHPSLNVLGGCCGTNHRHVDAISRACVV